jgi:hypothetical protein
MNIDKIVEIIRNLKEESVPTMNTASTAGKAGFGGSAQGFDPGPTAGYDKVLNFDGRGRIARLLPPLYKKDLLTKRKKQKK